MALVAAGIGLVVGTARLAAIDAGAARGRPGEQARAVGFVAAVPRREDGQVRVELQTPDGKLLLRAPEPVGDLEVGAEVRAEGTIVEPEPWRAPWLRRRGIAIELDAPAIERTGGHRGGLAGRVDEIRARAERALGRGMPDPEADLARGFVLGQDDRVDPRTVDDFKRSGLQHLVAVSGENVILLCLLAWPLLALVGLTLRARLIALLALIALYVAITGAGPSIQRAGVMGAAGVMAGLASTPRARWHALLLAVAVTLAINPRVTGDVGWQLSFAATVGIMLWGSRLASVLAGDARRGSIRRTLAEGVAVTAAATLATAPLMAHAFDYLPVAALPANLLALPAVAPAMWLGMLAGIAGQVPAIPVEPINWLNSVLLAYVAQVAHWLAAPGWATIDVGIGRPPALAGAYAALIALAEAGLAAGRRRRGLTVAGPRRGRTGRTGRANLIRRWALAAAVAAAAIAAAVAAPGSGGPGGPSAGDLRVQVLDVGQGDSILLDPPGADPVLVDAGPADADVADDLRAEGVGSLDALVVTHDQADHAGGAFGVLRSLRVRRFAFGRVGPDLLAAARGAGSGLTRLAEGDEVRAADLRLEVLWPPRELLAGPAEDPNDVALVMLAEWRHFSILLTADAEAEAVPIDPGPVDVLKVAHHGSEDSGLGPLLDRIVPKLAVISVGAGNPYGHPTAQVLGELRRRQVPALRTDRVGMVTIDAGPSGWTVKP